MPSTGIFRSVPPETAERTRTPYDTMRPPSNVPYVVDNLWEWKRPEAMACRRFSAYASPSAGLARKYGGDGKGQPYRVIFLGDVRLCQLQGYGDARKHPDCYELKKLVKNILGTPWVNLPVEEKQQVGCLYMPCLRKGEVETLFEEVEVLRAARDEIWENISFWDDVVLLEDAEHVVDEEGEIFFEYPGGYRLEAV